MTGSDCNNPLLQAVQPQVAEQYYNALIASLGYDVGVQLDAGGAKGKGLFTTKPVQSGDIIFTERPLVGVQHLDSKLHVSTCGRCFRAVGTVEQHLGGKICCLINELSEAAEEEDDRQQVQEQVDKINAAVNSAFLEGLLSGQVQLPLTDKVEVPQPVMCRGGCGEPYCCTACEAAAWVTCHCLLCPVGDDAGCNSSHNSSGDRKNGKGKEPMKQSASASWKPSRRNAGSSTSSSTSSSRQPPAGRPLQRRVHGVTVNRAKLEEFFHHADEANDIFRVAAQVIATTLVAADNLLLQQAAEDADDAEAQAAFSRACSAAISGASTAQLAVHPSEGIPPSAATGAAGTRSFSSEALCAASTGTGTAHPSQQQQHLAALQAAFLPFALGHKAPWWEVVQGDGGDNDGDDSDGGGLDSLEELQAQLKELTQESLSLLAAALHDDRFPWLFDLQLYGSLVGMFELNNLALSIPAPVAQYKEMLQAPAAWGLDAHTAAAALAEVAPLLEALGDSADLPAEGTGFYAVQSTINHSCIPNAKAVCLPNSQLEVLALSSLPAGAEVLLSYIDEEGAGREERQVMLRDYGFVCKCERCEAEGLADQLLGTTVS